MNARLTTLMVSLLCRLGLGYAEIDAYEAMGLSLPSSISEPMSESESGSYIDKTLQTSNSGYVSFAPRDGAMLHRSIFPLRFFLQRFYDPCSLPMQ